MIEHRSADDPTAIRQRRQAFLEASIEDDPPGRRWISVYCQTQGCRTPGGAPVKLCEISAPEMRLIKPGETVAIKCKRCNELTVLQGGTNSATV